MKNALHTTRFALVGLLVLGMGGTSATGAEEKPDDYELRPLVSRYAKTSSRITVTAGFKAFREAELQEAENFDGIGFDLDLVVPFGNRFQLRVNVPFYTAGDARLVSPPHQGISIWGFSDTTDFANVQGDWQFIRQEERGFNMSLGGGVGAPLRYLNTSIDDRYNHVGRVGLGGIKFDRRFNDRFTLLANAGVRYYWESDDMNPSEGGDVFAHADLSVAAIFNPFGHKLYPVVEVVYAGDFGDYNSILILPEIIWPLSHHFELKAGLTFGLTSDGESVGARAQAVARF